MRSLFLPDIAPTGTKPLKILTASKNNNSTPDYWLVGRQLFMPFFVPLWYMFVKLI